MTIATREPVADDEMSEAVAARAFPVTACWDVLAGSADRLAAEYGPCFECSDREVTVSIPRHRVGSRLQSEPTTQRDQRLVALRVGVPRQVHRHVPFVFTPRGTHKRPHHGDLRVSVHRDHLDRNSMITEIGVA